MGIENLLFLDHTKASGDGFRVQFFHYISNEGKIIGQSPSGVEILEYFFVTRGYIKSCFFKCLIRLIHHTSQEKRNISFAKNQ